MTIIIMVDELKYLRPVASYQVGVYKMGILHSRIVLDDLIEKRFLICSAKCFLCCVNDTSII